jgi:hypothetical protein
VNVNPKSGWEGIQKRDEWRIEFAAWLETFPWLWFGSLTFRPGLTQAQARWRLRAWAAALREALGTGDFGWVGVPEHGRTGFNFHYHVLIAGLREYHASRRAEWMRRWNKIGGDALITTFNPGAGGIDYIIKNCGPNDVDSIELEIKS